MRNCRIVDCRHFSVDVALELCPLLGILLLPLILCSLALGYYLAKLLVAAGIKFLHVVPHNPRILGVTAKVLNGLFVAGTRLAERTAVSAALALEVLAVSSHATLAHNGLADDERGALLLGVRRVDCCADCSRVSAVDHHHLPVPCAVLCGSILKRHLVAVGRELHVVAVVEHDEVVQSQEAGNASCALRNLLLDTAIGDKGIGLVRPHLTKTLGKETLGYCRSHAKHMALAKRTRSVLDAAHHVALRVTGSHAAPLAEIL